MDRIRRLYFEEGDAAEWRRRQDRLTAIGTLAVGVAHDINNSIGASLLAAETALQVLQESTCDPKVPECLRDIIGSMNRCGQVVRDTLRFSANVRCERQFHCLNGLVRRLRDVVMASPSMRSPSIVLKLDDSLPKILINDLEIELVLMNLISNAVYNAAHSPRIVISTAMAPSGVRFTVSDNGAGMTVVQKSRAFEPFYSTRKNQGGTGLGLSIVHGIIESHGGSIEIDSELGRGTSIRICLPLKPPDSPERA